MTDELKAEREAFEAWIRQYNSSWIYRAAPTGEYLETHASVAWMAWQARAKLDLAAQDVPPGWLWYSADLSCLCNASNKNPRAIIGFIRDIPGQAWWHSLSEEEQETTGLYVYAEGKSFNEAFALACNLTKIELVAPHTTGGMGMTEQMTLEQVTRQIEILREKDRACHQVADATLLAWKDAIDAHLNAAKCSHQAVFTGMINGKPVGLHGTIESVEALEDHLNAAKGEAVAWQYREVTEDGPSPVWDEASRMHFEILRNDRRYEVRELYTHSASPDVVRDAERYRWLRDIGDATWTALSERLPHYNIDKAIDAAIAAQRNKT